MTLPEVERAIADLQPSVRAEKEYGAGKRNPWAGSSEKLAALEKQRDELRAKTARDRIQSVLDAYERARSAYAEASAAYAQAIRRREQHDRGVVVMRYKDALHIARRHGVGQRFENWTRWFESARHKNQMSPDEYPVASFPEACRFSDNDRKCVHAWLRARDVEKQTYNARDAAAARLAALEHENPELRAVKVA